MLTLNMSSIKLNPTITRFLPALIWMGLIFFFSSIPDLSLHGQLSVYDFVLRKLAHITEYAILTICYYYALPNMQTKKRLLLSAVISIVYATTDEFHQSFVYRRTGHLSDVAIDSIGVLISLVLIKSVHAKKAHRS